MVFQYVLKSLFAHLLILCLLSAIAACTVATLLYHSYRQNVLTDRQAVELSNTAQTMAPLVIRASQNYQRRTVRQFLRIFAAFPYVRCVNLRQSDVIIQSWPALQCSSTKDANASPKWGVPPTPPPPWMSMRSQREAAIIPAERWA